MNSKIWKSLCECLKRNTTIQPSHRDEDSDVLALAIIELFSDRHVKPTDEVEIVDVKFPYEWGPVTAAREFRDVYPDGPEEPLYFQQYGRAKRSTFSHKTNEHACVVDGKEYRTVTFDKAPSGTPEGDGWTLHSSTSFDATWVRDTQAPKRFDCHRWPGCGCPDGTIATDCPGTTRAAADDEWRDATAADVEKEFLVKTFSGRVTIGRVGIVKATGAVKVTTASTHPLTSGFFDHVEFAPHFKIRGIPS